MKQLNANIGAVHPASNSHKDVKDGGRCQPGHVTGASKSSNTATATTERSKATRVVARANSIADFLAISYTA